MEWWGRIFQVRQISHDTGTVWYGVSVLLVKAVHRKLQAVVVCCRHNDGKLCIVEVLNVTKYQVATYRMRFSSSKCIRFRIVIFAVG